MNKIKEQVLSLLPKEFQPIINNIDFDKLEEFVETLISGYIARRGVYIVKREIDVDGQSETTNFFNHIIEIGSIFLWEENHLMSSDKVQNENTLGILAYSLNLCLSVVLKRKNVYQSNFHSYYDSPTLGALMGRMLAHPDNAMRNIGYTKHIADNCLFNKI